MQSVPKKNKLKVFLSETSGDAIELQKKLKRILSKAGLEVLFIKKEDFDNEESAIKKIKEYIEISDCSIHLLGNEYGEIFDKKNKLSISEYQYTEAQNKNRKLLSGFKMFVWQPFSINTNEKEEAQEVFLDSIMQNILRNMIFSNHDSPVMFVEDIRSIIQLEQKTESSAQSTDMFFIYNELDEDSAQSITELLSDIADVESLSISQNANADFSSMVAQQFDKSILTVVFFKTRADWALPFVQQVWKKVGGASAKSNILLIGDANQESNHDKMFKAPKVQSLIIAEELIPLEIKVQFDKINSQNE